RAGGVRAGLPLAWLPAGGGGVEGPLILAAAVLLGLVLAAEPLLWCLGVLAVALACGAAVFAGEQAEGSYRFLGDQRLPPGRGWAVKTACWLAWAVLAAAPGRLGGGASRGGWGAPPAGGAAWQTLKRLLGEDLLPGVTRGEAFVLTLAYGFATGHFAALVLQRRVVAVAVAAVATAAFLYLWLPSLLLGGLTLW